MRGGCWSLLLLGFAASCGGGSGDGGGGPPVDDAVASVTMEPAVDTLLVASTGRLSAVARNADGDALPSVRLAWSSSDSGVAFVNDEGVVTARAIGVATIIARAGGREARATILTSAEIAITPRLPSLFAGDTLLLRAVATDGQGSVLSSPVAWTVNAPSIGEVDAAGVVLGRVAGTVRVSAALGAGSASVDVVVLPRRSTVLRPLSVLRGGQLWMVDRDNTGAVRIFESANQYAWSPNGARLVVGDRGGGLALVNADGSGFAPFAAGLTPHWSPDGSQVAYWRSDVPLTSVFTRLVAGGPETLLASGVNPRWSPDGRQIAFRRDVPGTKQLWLMDADGSRQRRVAASIASLWFDWSPDGKQIAIVAGTTFGLGPTPGVFVLDVDGERLRAISSNCSDSGACGTPRAFGTTWAPDASRLAFIEDRTIRIAARSGAITTIPLVLTCCTTLDTLAWSPDGASLAFVGTDVATAGDPFPRSRVAVVPVSGGTPVDITPIDTTQGSPAWRP